MRVLQDRACSLETCTRGGWKAGHRAEEQERIDAVNETRAHQPPRAYELNLLEKKFLRITQDLCLAITRVECAPVLVSCRANLSRLDAKGPSVLSRNRKLTIRLQYMCIYTYDTDGSRCVDRWMRTHCIAIQMQIVAAGALVSGRGQSSASEWMWARSQGRERENRKACLPAMKSLDAGPGPALQVHSRSAWGHDVNGRRCRRPLLICRRVGSGASLRHSLPMQRSAPRGQKMPLSVCVGRVCGCFSHLAFHVPRPG